MTTAAVGVYVHADPRGLARTLAALDARENSGLEVILLGDGPDRPTRGVLARLGLLRQPTTDQPLGPPACFNRLAALTDADVVVLLESGALPAPGTLDRLVTKLGGECGAGIAGPSTNFAWNEQCVLPAGGGDWAQITRDGRRVLRRFGGVVRMLAPLHSLADFCYAVRRAVINEIGGADEGFGLGPCWEMEYSIRAVRSGFDCVWICGAYVWRPPLTVRRRIEEGRLFDSSRRRYQDSVRGLRLRRERSGYESHCRGDACEHFAPC